MPRIKSGKPWIRFDGYRPRLLLHEKAEARVRWAMRGLTALGVGLSVVTLPWHWALAISVLLVAIDTLLELTVFYYTSLYINALPDFEWDGEKWYAMLFQSYGPPEDKNSMKMVGLVFTDAEYAKKVFEMIRTWNHGEQEDTSGNIRLSFIVDDEAYWVMVYSDPGKKAVRKLHRSVKQKNKKQNNNNEHFGLVMGISLCKGFFTNGPFALMMFVENQPKRKPFLFAPFVVGNRGMPVPIEGVEPLVLNNYYYKHYSHLEEDEFEHHYYHSIIHRNRSG